MTRIYRAGFARFECACTFAFFTLHFPPWAFLCSIHCHIYTLAASRPHRLLAAATPCQAFLSTMFSLTVISVISYGLAAAMCGFLWYLSIIPLSTFKRGSRVVTMFPAVSIRSMRYMQEDPTCRLSPANSVTDFPLNASRALHFLALTNVFKLLNPASPQSSIGQADQPLAMSHITKLEVSLE